MTDEANEPKIVRCLQNRSTGQLFAYTDEIAKRPDMIPYDGPVQTGQSPDVLASQRTLEEQVAESDRKVGQMLREQQGQLDEANRASAIERQKFESENERLRAEIEELKAGKPAEVVPTPAPTAVLAEPEGNMQVIAASDPVAVTAEPGTPAETPATEWALPDNATVVAHTTQPVISTDAPAPDVEAATATAGTVTPETQEQVAPVATGPVVTQPVAAPAQPVLPAAAADVAAALQ